MGSPFSRASRLPTPWLERQVYSQAVTTDAALVFAAGQAAFGVDGALIGVGDIEAQVRQTYANVATVLEDCGATLQTIVQQTIYLRSIEDISVVRRVIWELLKPPLPAATAVRCDLLHPDMLFEVDVIAAVGVGRS
jgi:enamine deaminase RidA (YjgF/YER057c/UK114 family)